MIKYTILEHQHRYTVWAAARAAQRGHLGFDLALANQMIEATRLHGIEHHHLPNPQEIDDHHRIWCESALKVAMNRGAPMMYGRAAQTDQCLLQVPFCSFGTTLPSKSRSIAPTSWRHFDGKSK